MNESKNGFKAPKSKSESKCEKTFLTTSISSEDTGHMYLPQRSPRVSLGDLATGMFWSLMNCNKNPFGNASRSKVLYHTKVIISTFKSNWLLENLAIP